MAGPFSVIGRHDFVEAQQQGGGESRWKMALLALDQAMAHALDRIGVMLVRWRYGPVLQPRDVHARQGEHCVEKAVVIQRHGWQDVGPYSLLRVRVGRVDKRRRAIQGARKDR